MRVPEPSVTLEQVAVTLGVTRERTRQIERAALERVRTVRAYLRWRAHVLGGVEAVAREQGLPRWAVAAYLDVELPTPDPEPQRQRTGPALAAE